MTSTANNVIGSNIISLMYMRNISGPSTIPWGTPERTGASPDDLPSTLTLCVLFVKYVVSIVPKITFNSIQLHKVSVRYFMKSFIVIYSIMAFSR